MAGVPPVSVPTPSSLPPQGPSQFNAGADHSKLLNKDLDKHLGDVQGKHKPQPKNKPEQHQPEQKKPAQTKGKDDDSTKHSHHHNQHKHDHKPSTTH